MTELQARRDESERLVHELQAHQIELEMQNRQLLEAQVELERSQARYANLYDFAPAKCAGSSTTCSRRR